MKELSLHILDLVENSIKAGATLVTLNVEENHKKDIMNIKIIDNGCGMDKEFLEKVQNPFVTTRTTRSVGLGISLMKASAERCDGGLNIESEKGVGTTLEIYMKHSHIDRAPLGNMPDTIITLINYESTMDIVYKHTINENEFLFDTREIKKILDGADIAAPEIIIWLREYIQENLEKLLNT